MPIPKIKLVFKFNVRHWYDPVADYWFYDVPEVTPKEIKERAENLDKLKYDHSYNETTNEYTCIISVKDEKNGEVYIPDLYDTFKRGTVTIKDNVKIGKMEVGSADNKMVLNNYGTINTLNTAKDSFLGLTNNGIIKNLNTGNGSVAVIDNNKTINNLNTGIRSITALDNDGTIKKMITGTNSISSIDNDCKIGSIYTGRDSFATIDND